MHDLEGLNMERALIRNESSLQTLRFTVAVAEQEVCCVHNHPHTMLVAQDEELGMVRAARRVRSPLQSHMLQTGHVGHAAGQVS